MKFQDKGFGQWERERNNAYCGAAGSGAAMATLWYETEIGTAYRVEIFERGRPEAPPDGPMIAGTRFLFRPVITFVAEDGSMRRIPIAPNTAPRADNQPRNEDEAGYQAWLTIRAHAREIEAAHEAAAVAQAEAEAASAADAERNATEATATDAVERERGLLDRVLGR